MRLLIFILMPLCILYFIIGALLVWVFGIFDQQAYLQGAGIVGALASILGLLSFTRPALSQSDIENIEVSSLQKLGEVSSEIKRLEAARSNTVNQIDNLETQKKEMELLVRKASMSLFLKEQQKNYLKTILDLLSKEPKLTKSMADLDAVEKKLTVLEEEIEQDANVESLRRIILEAKSTPSRLDAAIENASPLSRMILLILKAYGDLFTLNIRR